MNELFKLQIPYPLPKLNRLPLREQPAYRMTHNPDACNLTELLAVLVGGSKQIEIAEALLERFESIRKLHQAHATEIASIKGIGQGTALRLKAALELGKRAILETEDERPIIHSPADAAALVQYEMSLLEQEYLKVMLLDTRNRVIDIVEIYHGSVNSSQVRVAELFKPAIQRIAASIIALHNHPSGEVNPSPDDVAVTRAIVQAGNLLDIPLLDHGFRRDILGDHIVDDIFAYSRDNVGNFFGLHQFITLCIDDFTLIISDIVIGQDFFTNVKIAPFNLALRIFNRPGYPGMFYSLTIPHTQLLHQTSYAV